MLGLNIVVNGGLDPVVGLCPADAAGNVLPCGGGERAVEENGVKSMTRARHHQEVGC